MIEERESSARPVRDEKGVKIIRVAVQGRRTSLERNIDRIAASDDLMRRNDDVFIAELETRCFAVDRDRVNLVGTFPKIELKRMGRITQIKADLRGRRNGFGYGIGNVEMQVVVNVADGRGPVFCQRERHAWLHVIDRLAAGCEKREDNRGESRCQLNTVFHGYVLFQRIQR